MKQRLITGSCYILVLLAFFIAKTLLPGIWGVFVFDVLLYAFSVIGAYEMTRALGEKLTAAGRGIALAFAVLLLPVYDVCTLGYGLNGFAVMGAAFFLFALAQISLLVAEYRESTLESAGCGLLALVYPALLLGMTALCNHLPRYSDLAVLFVFVISPFADSLALVFGMALGKRFPKKMAPVISPKKTVVGGIGGIFGGLVGALALFFLYPLLSGGTFYWPHLPVYLAVGALGAAATEFGDLVESAIKRKAGIKDMGKILPGHGGILDRIDGSMYTAVLVYVLFFFFLQ